ncbi:MAG: LAGLIDADG family homing endonuclease [Candidatus Aenigmatarchaeota archaeon]
MSKVSIPQSITNLSRSRYSVNVDFFKKWSSKMAYILGFTCADGTIWKYILSWDLKSDKELLIKIKEAMGSTHPIKRGKASFRLRIYNKNIISDLRQLGITPNKSKTTKFPKVPDKFLKHFIRGVLDGDGWISIHHKKKGSKEISVGFSSGSYDFLETLIKMLNKQILLTSNNLRKKTKKTKNGLSTYYNLEWYSKNAFNIISYLFNNLKKDDLSLKRKYNKQLKAKAIYKEYSCKTKLWRKIEKRHNTSIKIIFNNLLIKNKLSCIQIGEKLDVHPSTIYRWLEKTGVRASTKRVPKKTIFIKCPVCGEQFRKYTASTKSKAKRTGKFIRCTICRKDIYRPRWWFKVNIRPLYSRKCQGKWQKTRLEANLLQRCQTSGRFLHSIQGNEK